MLPAKPKLPASFAAQGFLTPEQARRKQGSPYRRLMIRTEGPANSGKTEFLMSCPGPGQIIPLDRGFDGMLDNPTPPAARRSDFAILPMSLPSAGQLSTAADYRPYWTAFYQKVMGALDNPDSRTVGIDADNLSWNLQRLAEFGTLTGVYPQTKYHGPQTARMAFYHRMWESGKIIVTTNMVAEEWRDKRHPVTGEVMMDSQGKEALREKTGDYRSTGFDDHEYLWQLSLRHLYKPPTWNKVLKRNTPQQWGIRILRCKSNRELEGEEIWGDACNFEGLVSLVFPHIDPSEWGL